MLAPNYAFTGKLATNAAYVNYHREKWLYILANKSTDPSVVKILDFLKKHGINEDTFAIRVTGFFPYTSNKIHFKQVGKLTETEIETILKDSYGVQDPLTVDLVISLTKQL